MDSKQVKRLYTDLKAAWDMRRDQWSEIARFVGITLDADYMDNKKQFKAGRDADQYIDDPTAALSVNQAGDYLLGVMWGTGEEVLDLIPSQYVTELVDETVVKDYYAYATKQLLYHMNHPNAGFTTALRPYTYDQFAFGTSGIGAFKNQLFERRIEDNCITYRSFGVDNTLIKEGRSGQIEYVAVVYNWEVSRIVSEFGKTNGKLDPTKMAKLPKSIRDEFEAKNLNTIFKIVFCFYPREDFDPAFVGKRGTRYQGVWFLEDGSDDIFFEEDFADKPIAIARAIKVRNDPYGHASGTMLISSIRSVNFMVGTAIEVIEKHNEPPMGVLNTAVMGDSVLDTSAGGLTVFSSAAGAVKQSPVFPIHDVGDPSLLMNLLIPYLNEKITTGFKVDSLLDFASDREMTATESLQRYAIRGKSLAGFLMQQKNELLIDNSVRSIALCMAAGELGVDPDKNPERAGDLSKRLPERIIPKEVLQVMEDGRPWYTIRFNNELERLVRTEAVQDLVQIIQTITAVAALYPQIVDAVDWHLLVTAVNNHLSYNSNFVMSADDFKKLIEANAEKEAALMQVELGQAGAAVGKDMASAKKMNAEAQRPNGA